MKKTLKRTLAAVRELKWQIENLDKEKYSLKDPSRITALQNLVLGLEITIEDIMKENSPKERKGNESKKESFKEGKENTQV